MAPYVTGHGFGIESGRLSLPPGKPRQGEQSPPRGQGEILVPSGRELGSGAIAVMAATNKCLAESKKSDTGGEATKKPSNPG